jgi:DNA-directed RNA polymerase III subunit RPC1
LKIDIKSINIFERNFRVRVFIDMMKGKAEHVPGDGLSERLKFLKRSIASIQIKGMTAVDRGVISKDDKKETIAKFGGPKHCLLVTGYGLSEVMGTDGELYSPLN